MKNLRMISSCLIILLIFAIGSAGAAAIPDQSGRLQVTGNAVVTAAPDLARINLGVETSSTSAEQAALENAERMASVLGALKALGLEQSDMTTSGYNIYSYSNTFGRGTPDEVITTTYNVQNGVIITTENLAEVGLIVDTAVKAGANQVQSVTFDIADKQEMQLQALGVAIRQALTKADVMAVSAGETLGGVVSIDEEYGTYVAKNESLQMMAAGADRGAQTSISPGEIEVTARVTMEFWF
ncbi:MAG TPA: SIMPL domain-containing protein [Limnochordia bacterium]|nr:SIMPL domain-containing protein [Limnochordia bacterium]